MSPRVGPKRLIKKGCVFTTRIRVYFKRKIQGFQLVYNKDLFSVYNDMTVPFQLIFMPYRRLLEIGKKDTLDQASISINGTSI